MAKMEQVIKDEILRLARKEIRATCLPVARDVRQLKRTVSALRKTVAALEKQVKQLLSQRMTEASKLEAPAEQVKTARFSPGLIKSIRTRLAISQGQLATLVGVTSACVGFWEQGRSRPGARNKEALVALRKLGKREVRKVLAERAEAAAAKTAKRPKKRKTTKKTKRAKAKRK